MRRDASERHYVGVSRWVTILLVVLSAWVSWELVTIRAGWEALLEVGAGTGSVYLLRWYWWRINAWSELAAMTTALIATIAIRWTIPFHGSEPSVFAKQTLLTTALTTTAWIVVTLLTPAEPRETLVNFYRRVRPDASGWKPIAQTVTDIPLERNLARNLCNWAAGCAMIYGALFGVGKICLLAWRTGSLLLVFSAICAAFIYRGLSASERTGYGHNPESGGVMASGSYEAR